MFAIAMDMVAMDMVAMDMVVIVMDIVSRALRGLRDYCFHLVCVCVCLCCVSAVIVGHACGA